MLHAVRGFFARRDVANSSNLGRPCPERSVVVIGDVHGRVDLLESLVGKIPTEHDWVFVGDLIDRGENSADALRLVKDICANDAHRFCLMGNHERMLLDFLANPKKDGPRWLTYGGLQTLASFGIGGVAIKPTDEQLDGIAWSLAQKAGPDIIAWIENLPLIWRSGNLAVVHAAADPGLPIDHQSEETVLWGCREFLVNPREDGHWIAHGHTIVEEAVCAASRISVDTGAFHTGALTAAVISPDGSVEFVTA